MFIYNIGMWIMVLGGKIWALFNSKTKVAMQGRRKLICKIKDSVDPKERIIWIHCASLGEFEQGRPVIEAIKSQKTQYKILLTFFSPSGYEIRKNYAGADYIFYLPLDTPRNARRFVNAIKPEIAIFVKYEFWLNYLRQLRLSGCRTFIISAIFRKNSVFFRLYGSIFRKALAGFERLFVQDENSKELLAGIGITKVSITGDTRFDRVEQVRKNAVEIAPIAAFSQGQKTLVAGSTWPPDEDLLITLAANNPDIRFIIVPHETGEERVKKLAESFPEGKAIRYTQIKDGGDIPSTVQTIIIDIVGILSSVYAYADFAYIGGGFGVGIHNTLEAAVYGIPVVFGPNYEKFKEARELISCGGAASISDGTQLQEWLSKFINDPQRLAEAGKQAGSYVATHTGATKIIMNSIFK